MRTSLIRALLLLTVALATGVTATRANPTGGQVTAGSATISGEGTSALTVNQATPRVVIDWQGFSIGAGESATFLQPDASSIALNRVIGADPSQILGSLTSNGTVILVNRNGILFGESARVDVGGLVATTHDIGNDAFMAGGLLRFDRAGDPQASVVNKGTISIRNAGLAAFVAPHVVNDGIITANYGRVALGAGTAFTLDLYGDELISFAIGDEVTQTITKDDGTNAKALVENAGHISATEGRIQLTAAAARAVVNQSVNVSGIVEANSLSTTGGRIVLKGSGTVMTERGAQITAEGHTGGEIRVEGNAIHLDGRVSADGSQEAPRSVAVPNLAAAERLRSRNLDQAYEDRGSTPESTPGGKGGSLFFQGQSFVSLDGNLSASGWQGGAVEVIAARNFALNGQVNATGGGAAGGRVSIRATRETWEGSGSGIDVSGATGGSITNVTGAKFVTSANYLAIGTAGAGGRIDVTGGDMFLLSSTYNAAGLTGGGSVRLGGEYQGGKNLTADEIPNARRLAANDGVKIDVSAKGNHGDAGTTVIWSDEKTTFLGSVYATGGLLSGVGGLVEASSADTLIWRGAVETAINGERGGTLLLDPKNITIADAEFSQLQLILRAFSGGPLGEPDRLETYNRFGVSVSLDGTRLAVGASEYYGAACTGCGAVYLFDFNDHAFSGGKLAARIGANYSGGKNINLAGTLDSFDGFGRSVSLGDTRLAVGAPGDYGATNSCRGCGAVYLFTFADTEFSGGRLEARIGSGYMGDRDVNLAGTLGSLGSAGSVDAFGSAVSLDGTRLAVGAINDLGATDTCDACGAVYLFTFEDTEFSGGVLAARIGDGYTGSKDLDLAATLGGSDYFGGSVSLDGTRLAVGAQWDDGVANACCNSGAVYLFSFEDMEFSGGMLAARIGSGYTGDNNIDLTGTLENGDLFGSSVSLDGLRLAVGAAWDDGATNSCTICGAVYLFTFADWDFSGGTLAARIGDGYTGGNDINLAGLLEFDDRFGSAISLDGARLAVGAPNDRGSANACTECGAVYLFTVDSSFSLTGNVGYSRFATDDVTISPLHLTSLLNAGTAVVLQASNDITVNSPITANNPSGVGGDLTLQAGRSIFVNANIFTDKGDLTLIANDLLVNGVVDAYRDPGAAVITMAAGTSIDAGTGSVLFDLRSGAGKTNSTGGAITLGSVTAGQITAHNLSVASGDIMLASGTLLNATGTGDAVVLAAGDQFINNAGEGAIATPSGRFIIYSQDWAADTRGGLLGSNLYNRPGGPSGIAAEYLPTINSTIDARDIDVQGQTFTATSTGILSTVQLALQAWNDPVFDLELFLFSVKNEGNGLVSAVSPRMIIVDKDTISRAFVGAETPPEVYGPTLTAIDVSSLGFGVELGKVYGIAVRSDNPSDRSLGWISWYGDRGGGYAAGSPFGTSSLTYPFWANRTDFDLVHRVLTQSASATAALPQSGNLFVYAAQPILTVTANAASRTYGAANSTFSASITGLVNGDSAAYAYTGAAGFSTTTTASSNAGIYAGDILPNPGTLMSSVGYGFEFVGGDLSIDPATLIITASDASKTYGQTASLTNFTTSGLLFSDSVTGVNLSSLGAVNTANVGSYAINASGATGTGLSNYAISYVGGLLTVDPASLIITASNASKTYGQTASLTNFTTSGLLFSDSVTGLSLSSLGAVNTANVGSYAINASGATGTGLSNYAISYVSGLLSVNPALLTITANDASKRYGQQLEFSGTEFTTSGLLFSDVVSSVSLSSLGAPRRSAAGSYAITPSAAVGLGLSNYMISYVDGSLTVTGGPRPWVPQPVSGDVILPFEAGISLFCATDGTWPVQANDSTQIMTACAGN